MFCQREGDQPDREATTARLNVMRKRIYTLASQKGYLPTAVVKHKITLTVDPEQEQLKRDLLTEATQQGDIFSPEPEPHRSPAVASVSPQDQSREPTPAIERRQGPDHGVESDSTDDLSDAGLSSDSDDTEESTTDDAEVDFEASPPGA